MAEEANDIEKVSVIKQETMVSKIYNMQWLKNASYSLNLGMTKATCKQRQDHDESKVTGDKFSLTEGIEVNSTEESDKCHLTMDKETKNQSDEATSESNRNAWSKDMDAANMLLNTYELDTQNIEEEGMLSVTVVESIITAKLEAQCRTDEEQKCRANALQNNVEDKTRDATCLPNSLKVDQDAKELNLEIKHPDDNNNNNHTKPAIPCASNVQKTTCDTESNKASIEVKDSETCAHKTISSTPKANIKDEDATLSKNNEKHATIINSKKPVSNSSKSQTFTDKQPKLNRRTSRYMYTRKNDCLKEQESVKQYSTPTNAIENTTKNAAKVCAVKANLEVESNKTDQQDADKTQSSSCNVSSIKDKVLEKQQTAPKQFVSKLKEQEPFRSVSTSNRTVEKTKILEKTDKITQASKNLDSPVNESEKKCGINTKKSTTFVAQSRNSTYLKPMQTKSMSGNVKHSPTYGRHSYTRNNSTSDRGQANSVERKDVTKGKKINVPTDTFANNFKNYVEEQDTVNCAKSTNELSDAHETDTLPVTKKDSIVPVKVETHSVENKVNLIVSHAKQESDIKSDQCYENRKMTNNVQIEQSAEINKQTDNEEVKLSKSSSNLYSDNSVVRSQSSTNQSFLKLENTQQMNDVSYLGNNQAIWDNDLYNSAVQKDATFVSTQQYTQSMHFQQPIQMGDQMKQLPLEMNVNKLYDQHLAVSDTMRLPQNIPNTFDAALYEYNLQAVSSDNDVNRTTSMPEIVMDGNRGQLSTLHRYTPNVQQRPATAFSDFHSMPSQSNKWGPSIQDGFHVEQFVNTAQPATMHIYNSGVFGSDDFNNTHERNYLPSHQMPFYVSSPQTSCMQSWNPQYPVYHNSPCMSYTVLPNTANQSNNFNDIAIGSVPMCTHDQHKYVHYVPINNSLTNASPIQMQPNSNYIKSMHSYDPNNYVVEPRNVDSVVPVRFNRHYKKYPDTCRTVYDIPQYAPPTLHQRPQQPFIPARNINSYKGYCSSNQEYHKQNGVNYMQISKSPKGQKEQNFVCEDNGLEDIPPIISPKEFVSSNLNPSNKADQYTTRVFKPDYKSKSNTGYRQPPLPRYNNGFRRNVTCQNFPKQHTPFMSIGRGMSKNKNE